MLPTILSTRVALVLFLATASSMASALTYNYTGNPLMSGFGSVTASVAFNASVGPSFSGVVAIANISSWQIANLAASVQFASSGIGQQPDASGYIPLRFEFSNGRIDRWDFTHNASGLPSGYDIYTMGRSFVVGNQVTEDGTTGPTGFNFYVTGNPGRWKPDLYSGAVTQRFTNFVGGRPKTFELSFSPNGGLTLAEAAALDGYDHYSWISVVRAGPFGGPYPMIDGVGNTSGGYDTAPFYWEEKPGSGIDARYVIGHSRNTPDTRTLKFEDTPHGPPPPLYDGTIPFEFVTSLVGVRSSINWDLIPGTTWKWKSNNNGDGGVFDVTALGTIDPVPWTAGSSYDAMAISLAELPDDVRSVLIAAGATNISPVPELATFSMFTFGGLLLSLIRSRSWKPQRQN